MCSLFPEDYEINTEDLVRYGMGLDLFKDIDSIEDARSQLCAIINNLKDSNLLIEASEQQFVKMHDVVRDVALWIASKGENVFMVKAGVGLDEWPKKGRFELYTAISMMDNVIQVLPNKLECPRLKILLLGVRSSMTVPATFFGGMKALKVLTLSCGFLLPQSLEFLTNLHTLQLEDCRFNDISSLGGLKRLEVLSFHGSDMEELPIEVGELHNLKLLDLTECDRLERIPPGVIQRLSQLEDLYIGEGSFTKWEIEGENASISELNSLSYLAALSMTLTPQCLPHDFSFHKLFRYDIWLTERAYYSEAVDYPLSRKLGFHHIDASSEVNALKELFQTVELLKLEDTYGCQNLIPNMEQGGLNALISLDLNFCKEMECLIDSTQQQLPTTAFSNLVNLSLQGITHLTEICDGDRPPMGFLQKLKTLDVKYCHNMPFIFPDKLSHRLQNLEEMIVADCYNVQEVFGLDGPTHQVVERNHSMLLSKLTLLHLKMLPKLRCICKGPTQHVSLQSLSDVNVAFCRELTYLFSSSLARSLIQLQRLKIHHCERLEQIILIEKEDGEILTEPNIQPLCFSKLITLEIIGCHKLESILSISIARGLRQLEKLQIEYCRQLKQVFSHGKEEDVFVGDGNEIVLPKLKTLNLKSLSTLTSFSEGNYHWMWPTLQKLSVVDCPKLTASFITDLETKLLALEKQLRVLWIGNHIQLHNTVIILLKQGLQNLESLTIEDSEGVQQVFQGISTNRDFQSLKVIWVRGCNKLKSLFSITIALGLPQLEALSVEIASQLEEVFSHENEDDVRDKKKIVFPQLKTLQLNELPRLISFCPKGYHFIFPSLNKLIVQYCPNITTSFTVASNHVVHAKEAPQLVKEDLPEASSSTTQATVATRPNHSNIYWRNDNVSSTLPPYMEESSMNLLIHSQQ